MAAHSSAAFAALCTALLVNPSRISFVDIEERVCAAFGTSTVKKTYKHTILAMACFNGGVEIESFLIWCARTGIELPTPYAVAKTLAKDGDFAPFLAEAEQILREASSIVERKTREEARRKHEDYLERTAWH